MDTVKKAMLLSALMLSGAGGARGATPADCETMAKALTAYGSAMEATYDGVNKFDDIGSVENKFDGDAKKSLEELETARQALLPLLREYASKSQDAAYAMQKCSR